MRGSGLPWSTRPALWALPIALLLIAMFATSSYDVGASAGYWTGIMASSGIFLALSGPVCAATAAIEGARLRRGTRVKFPAARSGFAVCWQRLWPSLVLGAVVQAAAFTVAARGAWGSPGFPNLWIFIAFLSVIGFHAVLGLLIGACTPLPIGLPAAMLVSYAWLGFAWAVSYFPLRYLAGLALSGCCHVDATMDPHALWATIVFNFVGAVVLFVAVAGLSIAAPVGPYPSMARPASDLHCAGTDPQICLYPEQETTGTMRATIDAAMSGVKRAGARLPDRVEAGRKASTDEVLYTAVGARNTPAQLVQSLSTAFLQPQLHATCSTPEATSTRERASSAVVRWLIARMAVPETGVDRARVPGFDDGVAAARRVQQLPVQRQGRWFNRTLPALMDCSRPITIP